MIKLYYYQGYYLNDKKHGQDMLSWNNGKKYESEWVLGKQNGKGFIITEIGEKKWNLGKLKKNQN
ncbi:unnamed protein product [Paramecium sonneborni]|uniref:MORN repeat protein n=1 Tax=Paramecium sonneborni TaxID=65129 RepID=A0A8S1RGG7_9CILI|nr:unnamed protein product [Paramecium sonneborni]